jgi:hypothetical protein
LLYGPCVHLYYNHVQRFLTIQATIMTKGEEIINIYFSTLAVECIYCVSYVIRVIAVLATSVLYHL